MGEVGRHGGCAGAVDVSDEDILEEDGDQDGEE